MVSKKKVTRSDKPTPAKYLLPMDYFTTVLRTIKECRNIAVRLPPHLNNRKWIKENFLIDKKRCDIVKPIEGNFIHENVYKDVFVPTFNKATARFSSEKRFILMYKATADDLAYAYDLPAQANDLIWWFYSEQDHQPTTLVRNFYNHMYYDDKIQPALIIDKWSEGIQSFENNYIPLAHPSSGDIDES